MSVLHKADAALLGDADGIDVREFRAKRRQLPVIILGAVVVPVLLALWLGRVDLWISAVIAVVSAPSLIAAHLRGRRLRVLLGPPGMVIVTYSGKQALLWSDVRAAIYVKNEKNLVLHLSDEREIKIVPDAYERSKELRSSIESYLVDRITVREVRSDAGKPFAALLIVILGIAVIGFIFLASFGPYRAVLAAGVGVAIGAGVGVVLVKQMPPPAQARRLVRALITVYVWAIVVFAVFWLLAFLLRRRLSTHSLWLIAAFLFGYAVGLFLVPLIVRAIRVQRRAQRAVRGDLELNP